jgi:hypothetical protein
MAKKNIDLERELSDDPENWEPAETAPVAKSVIVLAQPDDVLPPPALDTSAAPDFATLVKALAEALRGSTVDAITATKEPKRSREDHEYERISAYNPLGDRDHPRPKLECETFRAIIDEEDPSRPPAAYMEMPADMMTREEIDAANALQPVSTVVELNDGSRVPFIVYVKRENGQPDGRPLRKLLALPKKCYGKDLRNMVPNVKQIARQVLEQVKDRAAGHAVRLS